MSFCNTQRQIFNRMKCNTFSVPNNYRTPATDYPLEKVGSAEIKRKPYKQGVYIMEGVNNSDFFCVENSVPVTTLYIKGRQWMVDDPLHWEGMQRLAEHAKGDVLVGGLGLGLVLHALRKNPSVKKIDVYEMNKDVIKLMRDKIPKDINIHQGDIFKFAGERIQQQIDKKPVSKCPDTIILDIWVGKTDSHTSFEMIGAQGSFLQACPNSKLMIWGTMDKDLNPAVMKDPCDFLRELGQRINEVGK